MYIVSSQQRLASDRPAAWIWEGKVSDKASGVIARTWPPRIGILRYTVLRARRVDQLTVKSAAAMSTQFAAAQSDESWRASNIPTAHVFHFQQQKRSSSLFFSEIWSSLNADVAETNSRTLLSKNENHTS